MQNIDVLDRQILEVLSSDVKKSYAEMAKMFNVSTGTIHIRIEKLRQAGVIQEMTIKLDERKLGFDVCSFIGITLKRAKDYGGVIKQLESIDEVIEAYYTTGTYGIFIKVMTHSMEELHQVLTRKIQAIDEIQSTETLVSMQNPIRRNIKI
ncbi:transcriptional regulator AsnC [Caviibacterium pharyngocola]|uniref:Transcriptional regulator AsnC n=1 Tax=Caviibacterium pharyngocola TaxID=28159 RepID=A0A2M8RWS3_9PAST|nr:transcriptional regulator AsnC [Caviibacterium pharyngocola]PJG83334.1 transcriptional regulator AsnC [Caviibacterium pharyngocola]